MTVFVDTVLIDDSSPALAQVAAPTPPAGDSVFAIAEIQSFVPVAVSARDTIEVVGQTSLQPATTPVANVSDTVFVIGEGADDDGSGDGSEVGSGGSSGSGGDGGGPNDPTGFDAEIAALEALIAENDAALRAALAEAQSDIDANQAAAQAAVDEAKADIAANVAATAAAQAEAASAFAELASIATTVQSVISTEGTLQASVSEEIGARASGDTALAGRIDTVSATSAANAAAIVQEVVARVDGDSALAATLTTLTATVASSAATISQEAITRSTADSSISTLITNLTATVGGNSAAISSETTARATADDATSTRVDTIQANLPGQIGAAVTVESVARAAGDDALSALFTTLTANFNGLSSSLSDEEVTRAAGDTALSARINTAQATADNANAAIADEEVARVTADAAISSRTNTLEANFSSGAGTGGNLLRNSDFVSGTAPWGPNFYDPGNVGGFTFGTNWPGYSSAQTNVIYAACPNVSPLNGSSLDIIGAAFAVTPGAKYEFSAYCAYHRASNCQVFLNFYDGSGAYVAGGGYTGGTPYGGSGGDLTTMARVGGLSQPVPANAVIGFFIMRVLCDGEISPFGFFARPQVKLASPGQTGLTPYTSGPPDPTYQINAAVNNEAVARAGADDSLTAQINTQTTNYNNLSASLTQESSTRSDRDSALSGLITQAQASADNANAGVYYEGVARVSADQSLSTNIDQLYTELGGNSASISTLQASLNGLSVQWALVGSIDGVTGGLYFAGVRQAGGATTYSLEIDANVTIHGRVIIDGSISNSALSGNVSRYYIANVPQHVYDAVTTFAWLDSTELGSASTSLQSNGTVYINQDGLYHVTGFIEHDVGISRDEENVYFGISLYIYNGSWVEKLRSDGAGSTNASGERYGMSISDVMYLYAGWSIAVAGYNHAAYSDGTYNQFDYAYLTLTRIGS